ncbi:hypothetical protein Pmar_PMAR021523, partial [Perkinsus marinus ATCC 50983]
MTINNLIEDPDPPFPSPPIFPPDSPPRPVDDTKGFNKSGLREDRSCWEGTHGKGAPGEEAMPDKSVKLGAKGKGKDRGEPVTRKTIGKSGTVVSRSFGHRGDPGIKPCGFSWHDLAADDSDAEIEACDHSLENYDFGDYDPIPALPALPAAHTVSVHTSVVSNADVMETEVHSFNGSPRESGPANLDELLNKFDGVPASSFRPSEVLDAVVGALELLPREHQARGQKVLQVLTRHHLTLIENAARCTNGAPSPVLAPPPPRTTVCIGAPTPVPVPPHEAPSSVPVNPSAQPPRPWTVVASKRRRPNGSTPEHPRTIATPAAPKAGKGKGKGKGSTPQGATRAALERAKKATNKKSGVVELRSDNDDVPDMTAAEFMAF